MLDEDGDIGYAGGAKDAAVALDVGGGAQGFLEIVGEFDGGAAIGFVELADEAEWIEGFVPVRIAIAEIVGE